MNWNFLAMWIGMKTCDARLSPSVSGCPARGFALHSCHNVCHAEMCPALLVHTMCSSERYCPLGLAANWPAKATSSTQKNFAEESQAAVVRLLIICAAECRACDKQKMVV